LISFIALQFLKAQQVQAIFLWLWQVAVIQAKTTLLEDWRSTPTIALAFEQLGLIPAKV